LFDRADGKAANRPDATDTPALILRAMGLGGVVDERKAIRLSYGAERLQIGRVAVEMHRQQRARPRSDGALHAFRIKRVSDRIDIDVNRPGADVAYGPARADPRGRRGDHLGFRAYATRDQGHVQGRGAVIEALAMFD